jgi:hypothetical protein
MAVVDDPHYACAPLSEWVSGLGNDVAVHAVAPIPRSLRSLIDPLPALGPDDGGRDAIVVVGELDEQSAPGLVSMLRGGGWVVELVVLPHGLARTLLALRSDGTQAVKIGYRGLLRWSAVGLCGLQQWASTDPPDLLVTAGRRRAGPAT